MIESPTREEWARLYQAADQVKQIAPWEWLEEDDLFAIQDPESGEAHFISVMGALGEHISIAVYLGIPGLTGFWTAHQSDRFDSPEEILDVPHLQATFTDRKLLAPEDRAVVKQLRLKFRGQHAWPMFRSYRPGYWPWLLEAHEARLLTHALEQVAQVAPRVRDDDDLLIPNDDDDCYLLRVREETGTAHRWVDRTLTVTLPEFAPISAPVDRQLFQQFNSLPANLPLLEVDFFLFPAPFGEQGQRPQSAYCLMMVDGKNGLVLASELLTAAPTLQEMYASLPSVMLQSLLKHSIRPRHVRLRHPTLYYMLQSPARELRFTLEQCLELPALDPAKSSMFDHFA